MKDFRYMGNLKQFQSIQLFSLTGEEGSVSTHPYNKFRSCWFLLKPLSTNNPTYQGDQYEPPCPVTNKIHGQTNRI